MYVGSPKDVVPLIQKYAKHKQERFGCVFLNAVHDVIKVKVFFIGSDSRCMVTPRIIFWDACKKNVNSMIVFHNHPSGNPNPSAEDFNLTKGLVKAGDVLGIEILDHVIVSRTGYYSFLEHNNLTHEELREEVAQ